jgi:putative transcriptional regulator
MAGTPKWLKGQLLLDGGRLRGSFFHRSVVLICEHNAEGAFGLVLNRESGSTVGELIEAQVPDTLTGHALFLGGPVQPNALSYLVSEPFMPDSNVIPNLRLGHSLEGLVEIGQSFSQEKMIRIFAGYAGWSPGQLEEEMRREAWLVQPATLEHVFYPEVDHLWRRLLIGMGWQYRLLASAPEDYSLN